MKNLIRETRGGVEHTHTHTHTHTHDTSCIYLKEVLSKCLFICKKIYKQIGGDKRLDLSRDLLC